MSPLIENLLKVEETDHGKIQEEIQNKKSNPPSLKLRKGKKLIEK